MATFVTQNKCSKNSLATLKLKPNRTFGKYAVGIIFFSDYSVICIKTHENANEKV
jgi:hypothetical protein